MGTNTENRTKQTAEDIARAKELAVLCAEALYNYKLIARAVGRDEDTLAIWRKEDKNFSDRLEEGRSEFIRKQMGKAKPEFLLERLERETFAPPKMQTEISGGADPVKVLLDKFGVTEELQNDRKNDGPVQSPPQSST